MTSTGAGDESPREWRVVERMAISWLAGRHTRFDPDAADQAGVLFARKALVEMALLVGLRARMDPTPLDKDYQRLREQVANVAGRASYRELVARDEAALLLYAGAYAALRLCGHEDVEFRRLVERSAAGRYAACFERVPFRQLDLLHTLELAGVENGMRGIDAVLPFTLLCADPSVLKLRDRDIYAITHTVFYATDFGLRDPGWPAGFDLARAVELIEALSMLCRQRQNADLVAELLCSLLCLGIRDSAEAERAWAFLVGVQEPDGRVAGPDGIVHPDHQGDGEGYRAWATGYHTTIVTALAGLLGRGSRTVRRPRPTPPTTVNGDRIVVALRSAAAWLVDLAAHAPLDDAIPAAAAAARGARSAGEPALARPALASVTRRQAGAGPAAWARHGADVVFEFARGLAGADLAGGALDALLGGAASSLAGLASIPAGAANGVRELGDLGWLAPERADSLLASVDLADLAELVTEQPSPVAAARTLAQCAGDDPSRLGDNSHAWTAIAERLAAALPTACQGYHLDEVALLLRALAVLGWADHRIVQDGLDFLLCQQNPSGAFGHPACDDRQARATAQRIWTQSCVVALSALAERHGERPPRPRAAVIDTGW